jgi:hypothetical protein
MRASSGRRRRGVLGLQQSHQDEVFPAVWSDASALPGARSRSIVVAHTNTQRDPRADPKASSASLSGSAVTRTPAGLACWIRRAPRKYRALTEAGRDRHWALVLEISGPPCCPLSVLVETAMAPAREALPRRPKRPLGNPSRTPALAARRLRRARVRLSPLPPR